jgi:hypothetical protein
MNNDARNILIVLGILYFLCISYVVYIIYNPKLYEDCVTYISVSMDTTSLIYDACMNKVHPSTGITKNDVQEALQRLEKAYIEKKQL